MLQRIGNNSGLAPQQIRSLTFTGAAALPAAEYKPEGSNVSGQATKITYLYRLPMVLVLHISRFQYQGSTVKIHKWVLS